MKKLISVILIAVLTLTLFAACGKKQDTDATTTTQAPEKTYDDVSAEGHKATYGYVVLDDGTVKITSFKSEHTFESSDELRMPDTIDGKTVTVIGEGAFKNADKIHYFKVPSTLVRIEKDAFTGSSIISADLANSKVLTDIGENAFKGCESLVKIELPGSLTTIGTAAFASNPKLLYLVVRADLSILDMSMFEGSSLKKISTEAESTNVIKFAHDNNIPVYTINDSKEL